MAHCSGRLQTNIRKKMIGGGRGANRCYVEFLVTDTEVPGSIHGAIRFSEKWWVWNRVHSAS
jgi:hypothetical protein